MTSSEFESSIPPVEQPQTEAFDRAATWRGFLVTSKQEVTRKEGRKTVEKEGAERVKVEGGGGNEEGGSKEVTKNM
jgi:hypothetical protein